MPEFERRLTNLVDQVALHDDPVYHAQITLFRRWLIATDDAMEDESVPESVRERVLNRLVYSTPYSPYEINKKIPIQSPDEMLDAWRKLGLL